MKKAFGLFTLAAGLLFALLALGPVASAQKGQGPGPGTGLVSDSSGNLVRSDGGGLYDDGVSCVSVIAGGGSGFYQIRTVANTDPCNMEVSWWSPNPTHLPTHRYLALDFSSPLPPTTTSTPGDLDGSGTRDTVEKAPARFIANVAFAQGATTTPVQILILEVKSDGTTTQNTKWELKYTNEASITVHTDGSRDIFLGQDAAAAATANLFEIVQVPCHGGKQVCNTEQPRGTFSMPFFVTAVKK